MTNYEYIVTQDEAGKRLDRLVADRESELSRSIIQRLISEGKITVGDSRMKSSYKVVEGDVIRMELPVSRTETVPDAEEIPMDIIFEDKDLIVVNKPAGMVVHPAAGVSSGTLVNAVLHHVSSELAAGELDEEYEDDDQLSDAALPPTEKLDMISISPLRPGIVHRIDKDTSGTIVVAKTAKAYYGLVAQFSEHSVNRKYVALICGNPGQNNGTILAPIGRSRADRKKMAVTHINAREATTHFSIIERYEGFSLADITLETGRTHQIRVHLAYIGFPVVGDPAYGGRRRALKSAVTESVRAAIQGLSRQALHAQLLGFIHPRTGEYMEFSAPIPRDIQNVIDVLRSDLRNPVSSI